MAVAHHNELAVFRLLGAPPTPASRHAAAAAEAQRLEREEQRRRLQQRSSSGGLGTYLWNSMGGGGSGGGGGADSDGAGDPGFETLMGCSSLSEGDITCMVWARLSPAAAAVPTRAASASGVVAFAEGRGAPDGAVGSQLGGGTSSTAAAAAVGAAGAEPEPVVVLLVGDASGFLQVHDPAGRALFRQRLALGPLKHMSWRPAGQGEPPRASAKRPPHRLQQQSPRKAPPAFFTCVAGRHAWRGCRHERT